MTSQTKRQDYHVSKRFSVFPPTNDISPTDLLMYDLKKIFILGRKILEVAIVSPDVSSTRSVICSAISALIICFDSSAILFLFV